MSEKLEMLNKILEVLEQIKANTDRLIEACERLEPVSVGHCPECKILLKKHYEQCPNCGTTLLWK
jgi:rubrerythrin